MAEVIRRVRPTPTEEYLANPHRGCCTFQHFNGEELFPGASWSEQGPLEFPNLKKKDETKQEKRAANPGGRWPGVVKGYLPSTVAYCRWFWKVLEPEKGRYDFSVIDKSLEMCRQKGQTLAVRLMAYGSVRRPQPQVPEWYAKSCPMEIREPKGIEQRISIHDSPEYLKHWGGLIREFAKRYDANPLLESIDVTYIGPWGEGAGTCSVKQCARFAELWQQAFQHTPRLALIGGQQMRESVSRGSGWRVDCFGDLRWHWQGSPQVPRSSSWCHMYDSYPRQVVLSGAQEAWKTAPIHFETCWVPMGWYQRGYDIDFIIEQGLKFHGTYFMPKYTALPEERLDKLASFRRSSIGRLKTAVPSILRPGLRMLA